MPLMPFRLSEKILHLSPVSTMVCETHQTMGAHGYMLGGLTEMTFHGFILGSQKKKTRDMKVITKFTKG